MVFYPRRKKVMKKKSVYRPKGVRKAQPSSKMVKTIVKRALDRRIENKEVCQTAQYFGFYQFGAVTSTSVVTLSPIISQGVGENGRIGNTVKLKKLFMRAVLAPYYFSPVLNSDTRVPQLIGQWHVRLFIGKLKNSVDAPTTSQLSSLLRTGASTTTFESSNGLSLVRTVNTELFTVYYDKIHKIGFQNGNNQSVATGLHNNDFKLTKVLKIDCTKMMKKTLIFQDTTLNTPTNCGLYMWAGLCDSLMSGYTNPLPLVNICYDLEYSYEDA